MPIQIDYTFIDTEQPMLDLAALIASLGPDDYISIDTEFIRFTTYYPFFGLLQIKCRDKIYIVDPTVLCLKPLLEAINSTRAYILMFACHEDAEILYLTSCSLGLKKCLPDRIYDVQLLYAFDSGSFNAGLYSLIEELLDIDTQSNYSLIDCSLTDWQLRPLSSTQLSYAACDVAYLYELFKVLKDEIDEDKFEWFESEMQLVIKDIMHETPPDMLYRYVSGAGSLSKLCQTRLQYICKRRYEIAIEQNVALNWIITSKALRNIVQIMPKDSKGLLKAGVKYGCIKEREGLILQLIREAETLEADETLKPPLDSYKINPDYKGHEKRLKEYLKQVAYNECIAGELLYLKRYIRDFFNEDRDGDSLLESSWRKECCGDLERFKIKKR